MQYLLPSNQNVETAVDTVATGSGATLSVPLALPMSSFLRNYYHWNHFSLRPAGFIWIYYYGLGQEYGFRGVGGVGYYDY